MIVTTPPNWTSAPPPAGIVEMYRPSAGDGVVLYVMRSTWSDARAAVDDLRDAAHRAELTATGKIAIDGWTERADANAKFVEATLVYRDTGARTIDTRRLVVAGDGTHLVAVTGECFARDDADPKLVAACTAALATLDPGVPAASRVALVLAPRKIAEDAPVPPVPERPAPQAGGSASDDFDHDTPSMSDGSHQPMPPIAVAPAESSTDKRPIFVGAAVVMLGFGLWWNRRRRAQIEREAAGDSEAKDDDADDLHAAAKDDKKE